MTTSRSGAATIHVRHSTPHQQARQGYLATASTLGHMASNPPPPPPPPPVSGDREKSDDKSGTQRETPGWSRYILWILIGTLLTVMLVNYFTGGESREQVTYSNFLERVAAGRSDRSQIQQQRRRHHLHQRTRRVRDHWPHTATRR